MPIIKVDSERVQYKEKEILSKYTYQSSLALTNNDGSITIKPYDIEMEVKTNKIVPKTGIMMVGLGGNNGTTFTGMLIANKLGLTWKTKHGVQKSDFLGSVSQMGTFAIGLDQNGEEIFAPIKDLIPMIDPTNLEIDGWDISALNLADGMTRARVFDSELQEKLTPYMKDIKPRKAVFFQDFVAANQADRVDNVIQGTKWEQLEQLRKDIREFKETKKLDKILVMWVGNTERFAELVDGINDTWANLEKAIKADAHEISPSTFYAAAAILENVPFINGSPQNTLVPAILEMANERGIMVAGDDLKTGQTKLKSVLMDYLVGAGIRPESIVSYNHLGNNDGKNLSAPQTFRSKEISKRGVVEDMIKSNRLLYPDDNSKPDHLVVIKYVPYVADSKRAMDEFTSTIAMGGTNTLVIHNTCEDSLLAAPIMLDLLLFMELFQRMTFKVVSTGETVTFPIGSLLGYWLKAPITSLTNSLFRQRTCIENVIKAAISLPPYNHIHMTNSDFQDNVTHTKSNGHGHSEFSEFEILKKKAKLNMNGHAILNGVPAINGQNGHGHH